MIYRTENNFSGSYLYIRGNNSEDPEYKYEVTGMISLSKAYEQRACSYETLHVLIKSILDEGRRLESMELDMDGWILDPDYIFIEPPEYEVMHRRFMNENVFFVYYPGKTGLNMKKGLKYLSEFIIEHIDYKDREAVDIAYKFYLQIYRDNYAFETLL